jgi:cell division protease FtsH
VAEKKLKVQKPKMRKIMRGPLFWIVVALIAVSVFGRISGSGNQFQKVDTSVILAEISSNKVDSAVVVDKDQKIRVILKAGEFVNGSAKLEASYVTGQEPTIIELLTSNPPPKAWNVKVPTQSLLLSIFFSFAPILLIGFLLLFFMSNAQGGGKRIFSFGHPRTPLPMLLEPMRRWKSYEKLKTF